MDYELTIDQCRPYLLGILKHVDSFCRENCINYSLGYGSMIGAIRHKGFIPWDDDIDIIMTRENYDKFIALHKSKTREEGRYRVRKGQEIANHLHAVVSDEETYVIFRKGSTDDKFYRGGVWVDLFPLDEVKDEETYLKIWQKIFKLRERQQLAEIGGLLRHTKWNRRFRNILHPFFKPFAKSIGRELEKTMKSGNGRGADYYASYSVWYWKQKAIPKSLFNQYMEVEFEGGKYFAIKGYDTYLRGLYGDYMQYPPEEQRISKHGYKAYVKKNY